jgi:hypothetical protein
MRDRHGRGLFISLLLSYTVVRHARRPVTLPASSIDTVAGSAFGIALDERDGRILFAAVDDNLSVLDEWAEKE